MQIRIILLMSFWGFMSGDLNAQEQYNDYANVKITSNILDSTGYFNNLKDSKEKAIGFDKLGTFYFYANSDSALNYLKKAESLAKKLNLPVLEATNHIFIGMLYRMMKSNFSTSLYYVNMAKREAEAANITDSGFHANLYMQQLGLYSSLGSYSKAKKMLKEDAIKIMTPGKTSEAIWTPVGMVGVYYNQINEHDSAIKYSQLAIEMNKTLPLAKKWGFPYYVMADSYVKLKQFQKAIDILNIGRDIIKSNNYEKDIAESYEVYAKANFNLDKIDSAVYYAKLAFQKSQSIAYIDAIIKSSELLSKIYSKTKNLDSAYKYLSISNTLKDEISDKSKSNEIETITLNEELRQKQIQEDAENKKKLIIGLSLIFILGFSSVFVYSRIRQKNKIQQLEEDRKNKELQAARDLQISLLPKTNPKREDLDIATFIRSSTEVGGDYYDFAVQKDGTIISICGDATGHGVASGMMVSVTKAGLKGIGNSKPNELLQRLNNVVKDVDLGTLRMSLNVAEVGQNEVQISSAAMPPVYLYKAASKTIEEFMNNGLPLGGLRDEAFELVTRNFETGDVLIQLSDGLPEAPNSKGEMYDYDRLRALIQTSCHLSAQEIINILMQSVDQWLEGKRNPDDITIVVTKKK